MKFKKGDNVIIIAGASKGKKGKIMHVLRDVNRVMVEGLNIHKKHQRPRKTNEKGQVINKPMSINASNVMIVDTKSGKGTKIGYKMVGKKKVRIGKKSGVEI